MRTTRRRSGRAAIVAIFASGLMLAAIAPAQTRSPILDQIAKNYGVNSWDQIDALRYTWNAQFPGVKVSRSWVWEPKTGNVSYEGKGKDGKPVKVSYMRSELASQSEVIKNDIEPAFVNDNYWLLFPLHAYWDRSASVEDAGKKKLPIGKGMAEEVVVKYPAEGGGYTPGDTWTLFVGADHRVHEFVYHRGGSKKPTVIIATWSDYIKAGPILLSADHRGTADGKPLHLWFSDVAFKLAGSDKWTKAQ